MKKDRIETPTKERMQHGAFVQTETARAGVYVWQDEESRKPPIIDRLYNNRWIDDEQRQTLSDYRNDLHLSGLWRSPVSSRYGRVTGGEQSDRSAMAFARVIRLEVYVRERLGFGAKDLLRAVGDDNVTMPTHSGPPYWISALRQVAGIARSWRG